MLKPPVASSTLLLKETALAPPPPPPATWAIRRYWLAPCDGQYQAGGKPDKKDDRPNNDMAGKWKYAFY